jgi:hypothetical protein
MKENIDYIKQEITAEESYMENVFKLEKVYKKYKKLIFATVTIVIVSTIGYYVSNYITTQNTIASNMAFNTILKDPTNKEALATLKVKNNKLYNIAIYLQDQNSKIDEEFFKELSTYTKAIETNNIEQLNKAISNQNFLLKDYALFNKALIQTKEKKYLDAKETLKLISADSEITPLSNLLKHFLITK